MYRPMRATTRAASMGLMGLSYAVLLLMMIHITADVACKYFLNQPIQGTLEVVSYYYMVAAVLLPLPLVELDGKNVEVEILARHLPTGAQRWTLAFVLLIAAVFYAVLSYRTGLDAIAAYRKGEIVMGAVSVIVWPGRFILPAAFGLAAVVSLLRVPEALTAREKADEREIASPRAVYE